MCMRSRHARVQDLRPSLLSNDYSVGSLSKSFGDLSPLGNDFPVCSLVTSGHIGNGVCVDNGVCRGNGATGAPTP
jgi:hypothetical protein